MQRSVDPCSALSVRPAATRRGWAIALCAAAVAALAAACGDNPSTAAAAPDAAVAPAAPVADAGVPVPAGEPPAAVVRALAFEQYDELAKAGPMPATVNASGRQLQLRAKLFEARKESCRPVPQRPPGEFECYLTIRIAMTGDGSDPAFEEPSEQGDRLFVSWDARAGQWVREGTLRRR